MACSQTEWQLNCRTISERGKQLLANEELTDCKFIVGSDEDKVVISGHKMILAISSPVFKSMLFGELQETGPIAIPDVQPSAFQSLLQYIYTDSITIVTLDEALDIYYVANKYMYPFVMQQCSSVLFSSLSPKTACRIYEKADLFGDVKLSEACLECICTKTMDVLSDSSFNDIHFTTLLLILNQDILNIDSELSLFHAIERFAKNMGENNGAHPDLRDAIKLIRFSVLSPQEFSTIARSKLITRDEAIAILMNISSPQKNGFPMPEGFSSKMNKRVKNLMQINVIDELDVYDPLAIENYPDYYEESHVYDPLAIENYPDYSGESF